MAQSALSKAAAATMTPAAPAAPSAAEMAAVVAETITVRCVDMCMRVIAVCDMQAERAALPSQVQALMSQACHRVHRISTLTHACIRSTSQRSK